MDQANVISSMVMISSFFWLALFIAISSIINKFLKKPIVNGAEWYFWIILGIFILSSIMILRPNPGAVPQVDPYYHFGQLIGAYIFPLLVSGYLAFRFRKNKAISTNVNDTSSNKIEELPKDKQRSNWNISDGNDWK